MNKKLRYGLLTLLAFMGLTLSAQTTFDFDNDYATLFPSLTGTSANGVTDGDFTVSTTSTAMDGFTVTVSVADEGASNANRIWNASPRLRMYSGTLTISGSGIETIKFVRDGGGNPNISTTTGDLTGNVWIGSANEVVFTVLGNTQISQIVINGDAEAPEETEKDLNHGTEENPISVSAAIHAAEVVGSAGSNDYFYVKGTISSILPDTKNGNIPFTYSYKGTATYMITDGSGQEFEIFQGKYFSGVTWASGMADIEEGNTVLVCGKIKVYQGQAEMDKGSTLILLNGSGFVDPGTVEPTITDISVEDFLAKPVDDNVWYRLKGKITNLKDGDQYGNFDLVDIEDENYSVYVWGVLSEKGGEKKKFQELVTQYDIKNGGIITIIGTRGEYNGKIEVLNAYFEDYEKGVDPKTYTVTVEEALDAAGELDKNATSFDFYKVSGYVVNGTPNYYNGYEDKFTGSVDLYLSDTMDGEAKLFVYHGLGLGNEKFTESDLNKFTLGDKVTFIGKLKNYVKKDQETGEEADPVYELVDGYLLNYEVSPSVTVTMPSSGLATFCPARPILVEDQEVYIAKELQEDKVLVERVSGKIAAGVGLLIKGEESVEFDVEESGEEPEGNLLKGVLDPKELKEGAAFILVGGSFHPCSAGTFPAGKAYLEAEAVSGAKVIVFGGEATAISEVKAQDSNSEIYTIGGIRVKNAQQKGVYIINGKKVVK